jgi:hypothetical protein
MKTLIVVELAILATASVCGSAQGQATVRRTR